MTERAEYTVEMQYVEGDIDLVQVDTASVPTLGAGGPQWWPPQPHKYVAVATTGAGATDKFHAIPFNEGGTDLDTDNPTNPGNTGLIAINPKGDRVIIAPQTGSSWYLYPIDPVGTVGTLISTNSITGTDIHDVRWSLAGDLIAIAHDGTNGLSVFTFSEDFIGSEIQPSDALGEMFSCDFDPGGTRVVVARGTAGEGTGVYRYTGTALDGFVEPATGPVGADIIHVRFHPSGTHYSAAGDIDPFVWVYPYDGEVGTAIEPNTTSPGSGEAVVAEWSLLGDHIFVGGEDGDDGASLWGYPFDPVLGELGTLAVPDVDVAVVEGLAISPDGIFLAVFDGVAGEVSVYSTGLNAGQWVDITPYLRGTAGNFWDGEYGRSMGQAFGPPDAGTASFLARVTDEVFDARRNITGNAVRLKATYAAVEYPLMFMLVDDPDFDTDNLVAGITPQVAVSCIGRLSQLIGRNIATFLYDHPSIDQAIGYTLDFARWPTFDRNLDFGDNLEWFYVPYSGGEDAYQTLLALRAAEGVYANFYVDASGIFVFRGKNHRFTDPRSTAPQATFRTTPTNDPKFIHARYSPKRRDIVNYAEVKADVRADTLSEDVVYEWPSGASFEIAAGATLTLIADLEDPAYDLQDPSTGDGDYTVDTGSIVGATLDRYSGSRIRATFTPGAAGATITAIQLRGVKVAKLGEVTAISDVYAASSVNRYGTHDYEPPVAPYPQVTFFKAQEIANEAVDQYRNGTVSHEITFDVHQSVTAMTFGLGVKLGDRVAIDDTLKHIRKDYWVERIRHNIDEELFHQVTLECSEDPRGYVQAIPCYVTLEEESAASGTASWALHPGGEWIVAVEAGGAMEAYPIDPLDGSYGTPATVSGHGDAETYCVSISPDGNWIIQCQQSGSAHVYVYSFDDSTGAMSLVQTTTLSYRDAAVCYCGSHMLGIDRTTNRNVQVRAFNSGTGQITTGSSQDSWSVAAGNLSLVDPRVQWSTGFEYGGSDNIEYVTIGQAQTGVGFRIYPWNRTTNLHDTAIESDVVITGEFYSPMFGNNDTLVFSTVDDGSFPSFKVWTWIFDPEAGTLTQAAAAVTTNRTGIGGAASYLAAWNSDFTKVVIANKSGTGGNYYTFVTLDPATGAITEVEDCYADPRTDLGTGASNGVAFVGDYIVQKAIGEFRSYLHHDSVVP